MPNFICVSPERLFRALCSSRMKRLLLGSHPRRAAMGMFYNFTNVELVRIGEGKARIVEVGKTKIDYVDEAGAKKTIDLKECARTFDALERAGAFPPSDDTDWAAIADAQPPQK